MYVKLNDMEFGKKLESPIVAFTENGNELFIYDFDSAVEEAASVLYELGINRSSILIQKLLTAIEIEDYMEKIREFDPRIEEVEFSQEERKLKISPEEITLPINSKSAGYLGHISIKGPINIEIALQLIASINSITSIIEGSILEKRSYEMLKSSLETLSKAMESRVREADKLKDYKYKLFSTLIDKFDVEREIAELAFYVYDVGLIGVRDYILQKDLSDLTKKEWEEYRNHPKYGYEILKNIQDLPKEVLDATLYHHERLDGSGYPFGLESNEVPYIALLIGFVDEVARKLVEGKEKSELYCQLKGKFPDEFIRKLKEVPIDA